MDVIKLNFFSNWFAMSANLIYYNARFEQESRIQNL